MSKNEYKYGRDKEKKVAQSLRRIGGKVTLSKGSRGAADLDVKFPTGTKWKIQVKSSRTSTPSSPNKKDLGRLKQSATKTRSTPVIASVTPNGIEYKSARSGRKLNPIKKKRS